MIYKFIDIDTLTEEEIVNYFSQLSETRKGVIQKLPNAYDRSIALASEISARRCLNEMFHAPEFSYKLLLDPYGKSAVGNFNASISLSVSGNTVGCAVGKENVGLSIVPVGDVAFLQLQKALTDVEIRDVFSFSDSSFTELMNKSVITEKALCVRAAVYMAMKQAYYKAKGKLLNNNYIGVEFIFDRETICCSDEAFMIEAIGYNEKNNYVYAAAEEKI